MTLGATVLPNGAGVSFQVWAPDATSISVCLYSPISTTGDESSALASPTSSSSTSNNDKPLETHPLAKDETTGIFSVIVPSAKARWRYKFQVDDKGPFPDPRSKFQPEGVHGASEIIDHTEYKWRDGTWSGISNPGSVVIYELHFGTFTQAGTILSALEKLPYLQELGINTIEIMPLSDFAGQRNWGYDGVCLYSPARCYGRPEDLRLFVDSCHERGIAVLLDVVYNHFGPDGNYLSCYSPHYFTNAHHTPWGPALNVDLASSSKDTPYATQVRSFIIENALYWSQEFHFDGLRLDATHTIIDLSSPHILQELVLTTKMSSKVGQNFRLYAEDERNDAKLLSKDGLDGLWADDFHHQIRVCVAGDNESYFQNFLGSPQDIAKTIKTGWFYIGQPSITEGKFRGEDPTEVSDMSKFVFCIQNHDQVGNRPFGDRVHHKISIDSYRAISALLLLLPETPLLFMGQEWATSSPFQFFTDHHEQLGKLVTQGRRKEFEKFKAFNDPETREAIPDPQAESTFIDSKLNWDELESSLVPGSTASSSTSSTLVSIATSSPATVNHLQTYQLYKTLIHLRRTIPALYSTSRSCFDCFAVGEVVALIRSPGSSSSSTSSSDSYLILSLLQEPKINGTLKINATDVRSSTIQLPPGRWELVFASSFGDAVTFDSEYKEVSFRGPATVMFKVSGGGVQRR